MKIGKNILALLLCIGLSETCIASGKRGVRSDDEGCTTPPQRDPRIQPEPYNPVIHDVRTTQFPTNSTIYFPPAPPPKDQRN